MVINLSKLNKGVGPRKGAGVGLVWLPQPLPRLRWLKANRQARLTDAWNAQVFCEHQTLAKRKVPF